MQKMHEAARFIAVAAFAYLPNEWADHPSMP
jgi:hypothetical protein